MTTVTVMDDEGIETKWAVNEHIAVLYEVSSTKYVADAEITAVDGSGTATITFTVDGGTTNDTPCTLVYPLSAAKDDHTGVKDAATLLAAQVGTLSANLDVRVGAGTIQTTTPGPDRHHPARSAVCHLQVHAGWREHRRYASAGD